MMNHLKIVQSGWAGYTGDLGPFVTFDNGISTAPVPRNIADSITGIVQMIECDADGNDLGLAGIAGRLVAESAERAPVAEPLQRQSEAEKTAETKQNALKQNVEPAKFYTRAELEAVFEEKTIRGLREVAATWNVKHRSATVLMEMILAAQSEFLAKRNEKLSKSVEEDKPDETALLGSSKHEASYEIDGKTVTLGELVVGAKNELDLSVKAWNDLPADEREGYIQAYLDDLILIAKKPDPQSLDPEAAKWAETLLGSSILAATYPIGDKTVPLDDIVRSAYAKFGGTVEAWNSLAVDVREQLLADELQRMLPAA